MTSIEALMQVPGTQLQHIESTLRQLLTDLRAANLPIPAELDELIEEAAIAHAENAAYMNGVALFLISKLHTEQPLLMEKLHKVNSELLRRISY